MALSHSTRSDLLALVPEILQGPVVILDSEGCIQYLNPAAEGLLEWTQEEVRGRPVWHTIFPTRDTAEVRQLFDRVIRGETTEPLELEMAVRSGGCRRILWHYERLTDDSGIPRGLVATGSDVTRLRALENRDRRLGQEDRKRLAREEAVRDSEARFAGIIQLASDAIISIDTDHRIVLFNQGAESIFGWSREEVIGEPLDILLPASARHVHREHVERFEESPVQARTMGQRQEISGLRKGGEEFPAEASILKLDLAGERLFAVVLRDVSDRARGEARQRLLAEVGRVLSSSLDETRTLRGVARSAVSEWADVCMIDLVRADGSVERIAVAHRDPDMAELAESFRTIDLERDAPHLMARGLETGEAHHAPAVTDEHLDSISQSAQHRRLLEQLDLGTYLVVPVSARGRTLGTILFGRTVGGPGFDEADRLLSTELGTRAGLGLENALLYHDVQQALMARDDVLGVVSHDLGNPLQAIFIGLEALERERSRRGSDRPGQEEYYLSAIRRSADVMERLIHDLLEIRRIEAGHLTLKPEPIELEPMIEEALAVMDPLARVKSVRIETAVQNERIPSLTVDRDRIQQVLSNLVGNAVKHSPEGGMVQIAGTLDGDQVRIEITDQGPGIPEEERAQVFRRFWRGDGGRGSGVGLGLSIARGIVRAHGGRIWVESEVGSGSSFIFTLPLDDPGTGSRPAFVPGD